MKRILFLTGFLTLLLMCNGAYGEDLKLRSFDEPVAVNAPSILFGLSTALKEETIGRITNQPVILADGLKGSFEFETANAIRFYPTEPLRADTIYQCRLNPDFFKKQKVSGKAVPLKTEPLFIQDAQFFREARGTIRLTFNDIIDFQSLRRNLQVFKKQALAEISLSFGISPASNARTFLIDIKEPTGEAAVAVAVGPQLASTAGKTLTQAFSRTFTEEAAPIELDKRRRSLVIQDPPRFEAMTDGGLGIRVYLPNGFSVNTSIHPHVKIDGLESFEISRATYIPSKERTTYKLSRHSQYYYNITGDFKPHKTYRITFKKGMQDSYRFELKADKSFSITMGDRRPSLRFDSDKPYLSTKGTIGFNATNIERVTLIAERLADQNFRYFINFLGGNQQSSYKVSEEILNTELVLDYRKNDIIRHRIGLTSLLEKWQSGIYRFSIRFKNYTAVKTAFISDIGLSARLSRDQLFVTAVSLAGAVPVDDAQVTIYSAKNALVAKGKTDEEGVFILDRNALVDQHLRSIVVEKDEDKNFLVFNNPLNKVTFGRPKPLEATYRAMIYLQSELIRPGGDARFITIIKDKQYQSLAELPVRIHITDPGNGTVFDEVIKTDQVGVGTVSLHISKSHKTGRYRIRVMLGDREIGRKHFRVEAFMPQRIKNRIFVDTEHVKTGTPLKATVESMYLFGAPAAGLSGEVRLHAVAKNFKPKGFDGFSFTNRILARDNPITYMDIKKSIILDANGHGQAIFPTQVEQKAPSILEGQIAATIFDDGRGVSTYKALTLYPYEMMVGVQLVEKPKSSGAPYRFQTVLIDPLTKEKVIRPLYATLKRQIWHYSYNQQGQYRWNREYKTVSSFTVTPEQVVKRKLSDAGRYALVVTDRLTGHSASVEFNVYGWSYDSMGPTDDMARVELEFNDQYYSQGDVLKAGIRSPISGRLLVTVESDKVLWHRFYNLDANTAAIEIPLDFDLQDGAYLHAYVVRPTDKPSALQPFRAKGHRFIKPNREQHRLKVALDVPERTQSRQQVRLNVMTDQKDAMVMISVVDTGILQIVDQQPPDPFAFFYQQDSMKVALYDLYDQVMHHLIKGKLLSIGGDDARMLAKLKKHLAPETGAKRVKPFLFWSGLIPVDKNGTAEIILDVPNFSGQVEVVALGITNDRVGVAHQSMTVKDDVIVKVTTPRFMLSGDILDIPVRIFNTTDQALTLTLNATLSENLRLEMLPPEVTVASNTNTLLTCRLEALSQGKGLLKLSAHNGNQEFFYDVELPIYTASVLNTRVYSGENAGRVELTIPDQYFAESPPLVEIAISDLLITRLKGSFNNLIGYPYGCAEQTSSKMLAMLYAEPFLKGESEDQTEALKADRKALLIAGIEKLHGMQRSDGAFSYWEGGDRVNSYASVYADDVLLNAKAQKLPIPDDMIRGIYRSLADIAAGRDRNERYGISNFTRLYAAYLLSVEGRLEKSLINHLYDRAKFKNNLVGLYMMAAMLKQAGMTNAMQQVLSNIENFHARGLKEHRDYGGDFYSKARNLGFALYLHARHFQKNEISQRLLESVAKTIDGLYSTQDRAFVLRGLNEYYKDIVPKPMDVDIQFNGKTVRIQKAKIISESLKEKSIILTSNSGMFYYMVEVSGYRPLTPNHNLNKQKNPLRIYREYVDETGESVQMDKLRQNDLIFSRVRIRATQKIQNLIINDRIPSCFEIVNTRLDRLPKSKSLKNKNFHPEYQDIRDDRLLTFLGINQPQRKRPDSNEIIFHTPVRVSLTGICKLPPIQTEAMYDSRINDYDLMEGVVTVMSAKQVNADDGLKNKW